MVIRKNMKRRSFLKALGLGSVAAGKLFHWQPLRANSAARSNIIPPHRIVEVRNPHASHWDYATGCYYDHYDQQVVESMFNEALCRLTDSNSPKEAWLKVMSSYQAGDKISIKLNLNNYGKSDYEKRIDATAPVLNSIICGLVENLGIAIENIWIFDSDKDLTADAKVKQRIWDRLIYKHSYRPDPMWSAETVQWSFSGGPRCAYSAYVTTAHHLINFCLFKTHWMGVTAALKNHIGTKKYGHVSTSISDINTGPQLADIYQSPHIKNKTRLIVADGIFGTTGGSGGTVNRFKTCNNNSPNALFLGLDPVAFDSVLWDYLNDETHQNAPHGFLDVAANPPYNLGIHEHYHGDHEYNQIELIKIKPQAPVTRADVDKMILNHKKGLAATRNVQALIYRYERGI